MGDENNSDGILDEGPLYLHIRELGLFLSPQTDKLFEALAKAQSEIKDADKNRTADTGKYKYKYASLADVIEGARPALSAHGLCLLQPPVSWQPNSVQVTSMIGHGSGQWIAAGLSGSTDGGRLQGLQALGSAITYLRRYAAQGILFAASDDDDAQSLNAPSTNESRATHKNYSAPNAPPPVTATTDHHASWEATKGVFFAALAGLGIKYEPLKEFCIERGWDKPSTWPAGDRDKLIRDLAPEQQIRRDFDVWRQS